MARDLEAQRAMNSEQLAQRVKMGDHLDIAREIEHFALFTGRKEADGARAQLTTEGFATTLKRRGWSKFELRATKSATIAGREPARFTQRAADSQERCPFGNSGSELVATIRSRRNAST